MYQSIEKELEDYQDAVSVVLGSSSVNRMQVLAALDVINLIYNTSEYKQCLKSEQDKISRITA